MNLVLKITDICEKSCLSSVALFFLTKIKTPFSLLFLPHCIEIRQEPKVRFIKKCMLPIV